MSDMLKLRSGDRNKSRNFWTACAKITFIVYESLSQPTKTIILGIIIIINYCTLL